MKFSVANARTLIYCCCIVPRFSSFV